MKKRLLFLYTILICSIFFGCLTTNVKAVNGPSSEKGVISFMSFSDDYDSFDIYDSGKITNNDSKGVTYDLSSNTLTIKDFNGNYELTISAMGEDFKLNVVGNNDFLGIYVEGYSYKTNMTITGNGTLILNKEKNEDHPVPIVSTDKSKLIFEDTVSLKLYAANNDNSLNSSAVIACDDMDSDDDKNSCIIFKGENNIDVIIEQRVAIAGTESLKGFAILPEEIEIFKTATKDSKKYAYEVSSDSKVTIYLNELKEDPYSHKWYIGNTESDIENKTTYDNKAAAESAGYTLSEDKAYRGYYRYLFLLQQDQDGKQYGLIPDYVYHDVAQYGIAFDITDKTITIDSIEYKYLEYSDIDPNSLESVPKYEYLDDYIHYVKGDSLIIDGNKKNVVNPKTGVMDLRPIFLILIIGMIYILFLLNKNKKIKRNI